MYVTAYNAVVRRLFYIFIVYQLSANITHIYYIFKDFIQKRERKVRQFCRAFRSFTVSGELILFRTCLLSPEKARFC